MKCDEQYNFKIYLIINVLLAYYGSFEKSPKVTKVKLLYSCYFRVYIIFCHLKKYFTSVPGLNICFIICPIKNFLWHRYNCSLIWCIYVCTLVLLVSMMQFIMICDHQFRDIILQKQPFFFLQEKNSSSTKSLLSRFRFGLCYIYMCILQSRTRVVFLKHQTGLSTFLVEHISWDLIAHRIAQGIGDTIWHFSLRHLLL